MQLDGPGLIHLRRIDRTLRFSVVGLLIIGISWVMRDILLLGFAAVLIATVMRGASDLVQRGTGLSSNMSLLAVTVLLVTASGSVFWWRGSAIADQATQMADQLRQQVEHLWRDMESTTWGSAVARQLRTSLRAARGSLSGYFPGVASSVLGIGGSLVVIVATAAFLAASPQTYVDGTLRLLPVAWRRRGKEVATQLGITLQLWFVGQLADMVVVAMLVCGGLLILDVPLAPTLALLAGLFNFVPYVGALAGAVPAILVALTESPTLALWVALLFLCVQLLEGNVIAPLIQRRTIALAPALTILSQTILGTVFGILGLVVATPLTAAMVTAVRMLYVENVLERAEPPE